MSIKLKFANNLRERIVPIPSLMKHGPIIGGIELYIKNKDIPFEDRYKNLGTLDEALTDINKNQEYPLMAERLEPFLLEDLKNIYLGTKLRYNTVEKSEVSPTINGNEKTTYYRIPILENAFKNLLIKAALRAYKSDEDYDYKRVGRFVLKELDAQDNRDPQYVEKPE